LNGTVVDSPHSEHVVRVSERTREVPLLRFALHCLQRLGSFMNCLSWKKSCSPAVKTNSAPQSMHFKTRSVNSMAAGFPKAGKRLPESAKSIQTLPLRIPVFVRLEQQGPRAAEKEQRKYLGGRIRPKMGGFDLNCHTRAI
jgi:hypothetical protein